MAEQIAITQNNDEQTINLDQFCYVDDVYEIGTLMDDFLQDPNENLLVGNNQTNISGINFENNNGKSNVPLQNSAFGNPIQIPVWPVPPSSYTCSSCQTLREFVHVNGTLVQKLVIHGRLGLISHAVQERYNDATSEEHEYHMFDFCQERIVNVKQFLVQYCEDRKREGYVMLRDPLFYYYDALFVGHGSEGTLVADVSSLFPKLQKETLHELIEKSILTMRRRNGTRVAKSHIASQRERTKKMQLKDLAPYFNLTVNEASKELNICASALKSICRKGGLPKWPYRKIKGALSEIEKLTVNLNSDDADIRASASTKINEYRQFIASFYELAG